MTHESTEQAVKNRKGFSHAVRAATHYAIAQHHNAMAERREGLAKSEPESEDGHRTIAQAHRRLDSIHSQLGREHVRSMKDALGEKVDPNKVLHNATAEMTVRLGNPAHGDFDLEGAHGHIRKISHEHGRELTTEEAHPFHDHLQ